MGNIGSHVDLISREHRKPNVFFDHYEQTPHKMFCEIMSSGGSGIFGSNATARLVLPSLLARGNHHERHDHQNRRALLSLRSRLLRPDTNITAARSTNFRTAVIRTLIGNGVESA